MRPDTRAFDAIRGCASIQVLLGHYALTVRDGFLVSGLHFGGESVVMLFFVMSGFIFTVAYSERAETLHANRFSFWWRRARRVLPLYWASIVLHLALKAASPSAAQCHEGDTLGSLVLEVALKVVFLQQWLPLNLDRGSVNLSLWSLSVQAWFWAAFPFLLRRMQKTRSALGTLVCVVGLWAAYVSLTALALGALSVAHERHWIHLMWENPVFVRTWLYLSVHCGARPAIELRSLSTCQWGFADVPCGVCSSPLPLEQLLTSNCRCH
jgi:peptidoglycan/LPS O-acetylase OafA/YrhL